MVFMTLTRKDHQFGKGLEISPNWFLSKHQVKLYFHDRTAVQEAFGDFGLTGAKEILEPIKNTTPTRFQSLWLISCKK